MQTQSEPIERGSRPKRSVFGNFGPEEAPVSEPACVRENHKRAGSEGGAPTNLQAAIDVAVARSFIYRFVAKTFEDPAATGLSGLTDAPMQSVFHLAVKVLAAKTNSGLENAADAFVARLNSIRFEDFKSEYVAAFGHAARGRCPLNEIEYGDIKADPLFQPHRLADLGAFYSAFGLELTTDAAERHDHICLELEFMSVLAAKEAYALEHQLDAEQLSLCRDAQKLFLREHLGRWTPAFTRRLSKMVGEESPLGALADFTREFVTADCARLGLTPGSEDLLLRPINQADESLCDSCGIASRLPGALQTCGET